MSTRGGRWKAVRPSWVFGRRAREQDDSLSRVAGDAHPGAEEAETASTVGGSRSRSWVGALVVLLLGVAIAGACGYGIARIHGDAAERRKLQALLSQLETAAWQQSALEWQAVAEQRLSPAIDQERREVDAAAQRLVEQLMVLDSVSSHAQAVRDRFNSYDAAVDEEFALLTKGRVAEAEEVDEQRVDPAFARLDEALATASRRYGALAEQATRRAGLGTQLILLAAAIVIAALVWGVQRARSQAVQRRAYEALQHQALHDGLTGLPNRTLLRDRTGQAIRLADRELTPAALLLIDLDRFKEVNDTLGHHYGDQLLVQVGERLRAGLRKVDTVARLGGDEFAVLLPKIPHCQRGGGRQEAAGRLGGAVHPGRASPRRRGQHRGCPLSRPCQQP